MASTNYTVADLIPRIQQNIDALEYQAAYAFCKKALELEPTNAEILEVTGQVEIELELFAEARQVREMGRIATTALVMELSILMLLLSTCSKPYNRVQNPDTANTCILGKCRWRRKLSRLSKRASI